MDDVQQIKQGEQVADLIDQPADIEEVVQPKPFMCAISADLYLRASHAMSKDAARRNICGVRIEPSDDGGAILTATDGTILISIRDPNAIVRGSGTIAINRLMLSACKTQRGDLDVTERVLLVNFDGDNPPVAIIAHVMAAEADEARDNAMDLFTTATDQVVAVQYDTFLVMDEYPDWRRIVPDYSADEGASGASWDFRRAKEFIAAFTPYGGKVCALNVFSSADHPREGPLLVIPPKFPLLRREGTFNAFGIIMPYRSDIVLSKPSWV